MDVNTQPSILVRLVHSVPHLNVTLNQVNSTFDPKSVIYKEVSEKLRFFYFKKMVCTVQQLFLGFEVTHLIYVNDSEIHTSTYTQEYKTGD